MSDHNGLFAPEVSDGPEDPIDFRFPEMRQREELACRRDGLRHEVAALIAAMEPRRNLYRDHQRAQQAFGELCANGSRFGLKWEIDRLEQMLLDLRRTLGDAGIDADRVLRRANDATVVLQVVELKHRLRSIADPRVQVPARFKAIWEMVYRRASRRQDRIVVARLGDIARVVRQDTRAVRAALEFLDAIQVVITLVPPVAERWPDGTIRVKPGKFRVPRLREIHRGDLAERIKAMQPESFLVDPKDAAWQRARRAQNGGANSEPTADRHDEPTADRRRSPAGFDPPSASS